MTGAQGQGTENGGQKFKAIAIIIIFSLNLLLFLPSVKGDFIWDDRDLILDNPFMQHPAFLKNVLFSPFEILTKNIESKDQFEGQTQFYRPISILSSWLDFKIWGFNPSGFHLTNILLHIINAILFFFIVSGLGLKRIYALVSAVLFSLYPLHFENVAWISGRTDLLSFLFAAIATLFFLRYLKARHRSSLIFSSLFFFFSLLSKENCIFLFVIFFLFLLMDTKSFKKSFMPILPYLCSLVTWFVIRSFVLGPVSPRFSGEVIQNMFAATGFYTFKSLFPFHLSISINSRDVFYNYAFQLVGLFIFIVVFSLAVMIAFKKGFKSNISFSIIAFYLLLFPSMTVLFISTAKSLLAWRFLYAPSAVLIGLLFYLIPKWLKSKKVLAAVLIGLCVVYISEIFPKNVVFGQTDKEFWVNMKNVEKESLLAQFNAATAILLVDEAKALSIFERILEDYKDQPGYANYKLIIHENLAAYYSMKGELQKAKHYFESVLKTNRASGVEFHFNYASYLCLTGEETKAREIAADLLQKQPENHKVLFMAATFYLRLKEYDKAIQLLTEDYRLFNSRETLQLLNLVQGSFDK
jgi:tetratricopeptide (TPR) repeat protein